MSSPTGPSAVKRKRVVGEIKYYAVRKGYNPGIYTTWKECLGQVTGFKGATFKSFTNQADAELFMAGEDPTLNPDSDLYNPKFYGVRSGKTPGVYTSWQEAREQVVGWQKPKVRSFTTKQEAEAFVKSGPNFATAPVPEERRTRARDATAAKEAQSGTVQYKRSRDATDSTPKSATKKRKSMTNVTPAVEREDEIDDSEIERAVQEMQEDVMRGVEIDEIDVNGDLDDQRPRRGRPKQQPKKSGVLKIYTDGSALANGREEASAGVGVWFGAGDERNVSEPLNGPRQTNQRAELTAILRAIEIAPKHREVLIFSDSQYAINCVTLWHFNWIRNDWKTSLGKKVENQDLIEEILDRMAEREECGAKTAFEWVKGHSGDLDGNSMADRLAVEGAMRGAFGSRSGYGGR